LLPNETEAAEQKLQQIVSGGGIFQRTGTQEKFLEILAEFLEILADLPRIAQV